MIRDEKELLSLVLLLRREYESGVRYFSTHTLPEYEVLNTLNLTERERALFLTFSVIPFHTRPSGEPKPHLGRAGLWRVCSTIWRQHSWAYDPRRLVEVEGETELKEFFNRLELMDSYDAHWWFTSAQTILEEFDADPRKLLEEQSFVAPYIERQVRAYDLPGIADEVTTPFWVRLVHDRIHALDGMRWLTLPVDPTVFGVTTHLGELDLEYSNREERQTIAQFWNVFCRKHRLVPADIERPLRLLGLHWDEAGRDHVWELLTRIRDDSEKSV